MDNEVEKETTGVLDGAGDLWCSDCSFHDEEKGCTREEPGCCNDVRA